VVSPSWEAERIRLNCQVEGLRVGLLSEGCRFESVQPFLYPIARTLSAEYTSLSLRERESTGAVGTADRLNPARPESANPSRWRTVAWGTSTQSACP
jgi:hypothetical protein